MNVKEIKEKLQRKIVTITADDLITIGAETAVTFPEELRLTLGLFMAELSYNIFDKEEDENNDRPED